MASFHKIVDTYLLFCVKLKKAAVVILNFVKTRG